MNFPSIRIEGQIFSGELLQKLDQPDMPGQRPVDFGLPPDVKVKDEIARAWADAQDYWRIFQRKLESQRLTPTATTETRQQWIVPLLGLLGYQLEHQQKGAELNGRIYAISHRVTNRAHIPVHIVGYRDAAGLDRKPDNATLRMSPHAMVQEYINLHDQLYGIVTNGSTLRLLRDSFRLVRLNYLEFDLERIFTDGLFADFAILYRLLHASRLPQSLDSNSESILERYHQDSIEQGSRIRDGLRESVQQTIVILGTGFVSNPANGELREQLDSKKMMPSDFFGHLLRLIYRLLFLNVVEERNQLFPSKTSAKVIKAYYDYYSVQRLRRLSRTQGVKTDRYHDAWMSLLSTFTIFERPELAAKLGTTAFGGSLFNSQSLGLLATCQLSNTSLFNALDCLCSFNDPVTGQRQPVNFNALATEEFGSVYESLLELHPVVEVLPVPRFGFKLAAGNDRKTSGSYYTPSCLVNCLLDSALDPVLEDRIRDYKKLGYETVESAILSVKVCDPACGSGHFLIAAAQRIARRLAVIRAKGDEPAPDQLRHALREVIGRCIYGVDINPMSVELCRVALWLEAVEPGKPLSFLNNHIQCGNSLLGTTPALLKRGIPDEAFEPIEGDDKKFAAAWKKRNREAKLGQHDLFADTAETWHYQNALLAATKDIEAISDESFTDVERKEAAYSDYLASSSYRFGKRLHDAWCAAFVWQKKDDPAIPEPITQQVIDQMKRDPNLCPERVADEIDRLAEQYNFFHWHLAFPDVFQPQPDETIKTTDIAGWSGGFDCILGNPPWERMKLQEREWFAATHPQIAEAQTGAIRAQMIADLVRSDLTTFSAFEHAMRRAQAESAFVTRSGLFPRGAVGDTNTYPLFIEEGVNLISAAGRVGLIVKTGILADYSFRAFFCYLIETGRFVSGFDFSNRRLIFPAVVANERFTLLTLTSTGSERFRVSILNEEVADLQKPGRMWELSRDEIALINPNTKTCPLFQTADDAKLVSQIYRRVPVLTNEADQKTGNPFGVLYFTMFHMTSDSGLFRDMETLQQTSPGGPSQRWSTIKGQFLPVLEGKLFDLFDHRHGTFRGIPRVARFGIKAEPNHPTIQDRLDPTYECLPRYWVSASDVQSRYFERIGFEPGGVLVFRDVCRTHTDFRTVRSAICPSVGAGNKAPVLLFPGSAKNAHATRSILLCANLGAFVLDYVARQKFAGGSLNKYVLLQLPCIPPSTYDQECAWGRGVQTFTDWLLPRVLELTYTACDMELFAKDCNYDAPPFKWDDERRFLLRCELDAAFFHLYLGNDNDWQKTGTKELLAAFPTPRVAVPYIMDTFPIVKRKDEAAHGTYRTKDTILAIYDAMQTAISTGQPYQTLLDPPPGPPVGGFPEWKPGDEQPSDWPSHIHAPKGCEGKERQQMNPVVVPTKITQPGRFPHSSLYAFVHGVEETADGVTVTLDAVPAGQVQELPFEGEGLLERLMRINTYLVESRLNLEHWKSLQLPLMEGTWVRMQVSTDAPYPGTMVEAYSEGDLQPIRMMLSSLTENERESILSKIRLPRESPRSNIEQVLSAIKPASDTFVAVYNVGQGLCCAICNAKDSSPLFYFDMGCGCYWNAHTLPNKMRFCFTYNPPIILSHWHFDHFMAARLHDTRALDAKWIAPLQNVGPTSARFAAELALKGNLLLWPTSLQSMQTQWGDIVKCTGDTLNTSGLALLASVSPCASATAPKPYQVLLPGDAGYDDIPNNSNTPFDALVASHHGGSALGNSPLPRGTESPYVLSYGQNNTYHHGQTCPSLTKLTTAGWTRRIETVNGHVALGLPATVPLRQGCRGKKCDLAIQQR